MQQLLTIHQALYKALPERAEPIIQETLHPEFVFSSANGDIQAKGSFIKDFVMNASIKIQSLATSQQKLVIIDNTAILTCLMHIQIIRDVTKDNTVLELWERVTETYVQQGTTWKIVALHATYTKDR